MKVLLIFILFFCVVPEGFPENVKSSGRDLFLSGFLPGSTFESGYRYNPAAFVLLDSLRSGRLSLGYHVFGGESLHSLAEGNKGNHVRMEAGGYRVMPSKGIFSGRAAWETGVNRNTAWTNVRDAEKLYPYLVADSVGGDYHHEAYELEGSWAFYQGKGIYGLRAGFRGEMAYRLRDPRPKNTVSELSLNPGAMWFPGRWYAGAFFKYTFYRQHLDMKIEEPYRKDKFFVLKGMGLYDHRFSTLESTFSRYYRSHEYQVGGEAGLPEKGISFLFDYSYRKMEVEESDYRKPFLLKTNRVHGEVTWRKSFPFSELIVKADGGLDRQSGMEGSYEKVSSDSVTGAYVWRKLSESEKYRQKSSYLHAGFLSQRRVSGKLDWWYGADGFWRKETEQYLFPAYRKVYSSLKVVARAGFRRSWGDKWLRVDLNAGYKRNISSSLTAPEEEIVVREMLHLEYELARRNYCMGALQLEFRLPFYRKTFLAFYSDSGGAYSESGAYRWQTEAGVRLAF